MRPEHRMTDTSHLPPEDALREIGLQLQAEYRLAGIELPPELTPEDLARSVFDGLRSTLEEVCAAHLRIHADVKAALGAAADADQIHAEVAARFAEWTRTRRAGSGPAASA
jgi:hypothetical protein